MRAQSSYTGRAALNSSCRIAMWHVTTNQGLLFPCTPVLEGTRYIRKSNYPDDENRLVGKQQVSHLCVRINCTNRGLFFRIFWWEKGCIKDLCDLHQNEPLSDIAKVLKDNCTKKLQPNHDRCIAQAVTKAKLAAFFIQVGR